MSNELLRLHTESRAPGRGVALFRGGPGAPRRFLVAYVNPASGRPDRRRPPARPYWTNKRERAEEEFAARLPQREAR